MLSIVVPAHDEEACLPACLEALRTAAASLPVEVELVVCDDASTDRTAELAREGGARVVSIDRRQIAAARNAGARAATGERLLFVDADTLVPPAVLRAAWDALEAGAVGGGAGIEFDDPVPRSARFFLRLIEATMRRARWAAGCFVFCERAAFEAVGGFDETLYASEEIALSRALKRRGRFVVLRERVLTSGRKLRTHTVRAHLGQVLRIALRGPKSLQRREGLDLWYADDRSDAVSLRFAEVSETESA